MSHEIQKFEIHTDQLVRYVRAVHGVVEALGVPPTVQLFVLKEAARHISRVHQVELVGDANFSPTPEGRANEANKTEAD